MKEFAKIFEQLAYRHTYMQVFDDFLSLAICALSFGRMEHQYAEIIKRYEPKEQPLFGEMLAAMMIEYDNNSSAEGTWYDGLGRFFEEANGKWTRDANGQFFTPEHICTLMAKMTYEETNKDLTINDCACGSGRCLIAFDRTNPNNRVKNFYIAQDVDVRCVKMCTLNFMMFGMKGVVMHMDSLSMKIWGGYRIYMPETGMGIQPLSAEQCKQFLFEQKEEAKVIELPKPVIEPMITNYKPEKAMQLSLF